MELIKETKPQTVKLYAVDSFMLEPLGKMRIKKKQPQGGWEAVLGEARAPADKQWRVTSRVEVDELDL